MTNQHQPPPARSARSRRLIQQLAGNAPSGHRGIQRGQGGLETHGTNVFRQKAQALGRGHRGVSGEPHGFNPLEAIGSHGKARKTMGSSSLISLFHVFFYYLMALDGHLRECDSFSNTWRSEVLESEFVITTLRTHIQNRKSIISGPIFVVFGFNKNL